jgi:hypothetical protein
MWPGASELFIAAGARAQRQDGRRDKTNHADPQADEPRLVFGRSHFF